VAVPDVFNRSFEFSQDGRAMVQDEFTDMTKYAQITINKSANPLRHTGNVTDGLDYGSTSYFTINWNTLSGTFFVDFDMFEARDVLSVIAGIETDTSTYDFIFKIRGSNDNSTWTDIDSLDSANTGSVQWIELTGGDVRYRYIRLHLEQNSGGAGGASQLTTVNTFKIYVANNI